MTQPSASTSLPPLIPVEDALQRLLDEVQVIPGQERVHLEAAVGRVLAAPVVAAAPVPAWPVSAMDGYAVRLADLVGTKEGAMKEGAALPVTRRIAAGPVKDLPALPKGEAARIFTGAPLPQGADAVLMQEDCTVSDGNMRPKAGVLQSLAPGSNIRATGSDIAAGTEVLPVGRRLQPQDIGLLASLGFSEAEVKPLLRVALLSSGDELVCPGKTLKAGQTYNANQPMLATLLRQLPVDLKDLGTVEDDIGTTRAALRQASAEADCIISSGGVSVGEEDHVRGALAEEGSVDLWRLALKPGKPFLYGRVGDKFGGKKGASHFFGLPGNPVSAFVTFALIVRPLLLAMLGCSAVPPRPLPLPADFSRDKSGSRQEYLRVSLHYGDEGSAPRLRPSPNQSSAAILSLSHSDGLALIPPGTGVTPGDSLHFIPYSDLLG